MPEDDLIGVLLMLAAGSGILTVGFGSGLTAHTVFGAGDGVSLMVALTMSSGATFAGSLGFAMLGVWASRQTSADDEVAREP